MINTKENRIFFILEQENDELATHKTSNKWLKVHVQCTILLLLVQLFFKENWGIMALK